MRADIARDFKDIFQKHINALFRDKTLEFYGIKTAPIVELINTELTVAEVRSSGMDLVFLLTDGTYLHLEFQSGYNQDDLIRFAIYDLRLFQRDNRKVCTVIIYAPAVKTLPAALDTGTAMFSPRGILMNGYDGDAVFDSLKLKIDLGGELSDLDMMNLSLLMMMRNSRPIAEVAVKSVELAKTITDTRKRSTCLAAVYTLASRYLTAHQLKTLTEVLERLDVLMEIYSKKMEEIETKGEARGEARGIALQSMRVAKKLLEKNLTDEEIADATSLDVSEVAKIRRECAAYN
jgi:predicted transposase YdaD